MRKKTKWLTVLLGALILSISLVPVAGGVEPDFSAARQGPTWQHPFGTDWLGRDMVVRVIRGLRLSLAVGAFAALISTVLGVLAGAGAGLYGGWLGTGLNWATDALLALPHLVLLIVVSYAVGGGAWGVVVAVALTHWPRQARLIRELTQDVRHTHYYQQSLRLGHTRLWAVGHHILPRIATQAITAMILMLPHAILHESALSFLGMGIPPHEPAIGVILRESMQYLATGHIHLAIFPGLALFLIVLIVDNIGEGVRHLLTPRMFQE